MNYCEEISLKIIEVFLNLCLIGVIGFLIQRYFTNKKEEEKKQEEKIGDAELFRTTIIDRFINVFSGFYEIRKFYHSALIKNNFALNGESKEQALYEVLKRSCELESQYGELKVRIINHYNLRKGDWGTKSIEFLNKQIQNESDRNLLFRLKLDLLGEYYDLWRNSIEQGNRIKAEGSSEIYTLYNDILVRLQTDNITKLKED